MDKSDSGSDEDSQVKGPLHSEDEDEDENDSAGAPPVDSIYSRSSSLNENDENPQRGQGRDRGTKRRSEELAKWELANKREASRLSSMRCQQRKRKRMKYLKDEEDRLRVLNLNISQQNAFLRTLITTIRETLSAMPPHGMQNNPLAMAQALYNQGIIGQMQQQPQFVGLPQTAVSQTLNLSLALMASMNQQMQGQSSSALQSQALMNPVMNPQHVQQPTFGVSQPSINPSGSINQQLQLSRNIQNALSVQNAVPLIQNLVTMSQPGGLQGSIPQSQHHATQTIAAQLQQQLLSQQGSQLNQQTPEGLQIRTDNNPGSGPHDRERKSNK